MFWDMLGNQRTLLETPVNTVPVLVTVPLCYSAYIVHPELSDIYILQNTNTSVLFNFKLTFKFKVALF